MTSWCRPETLLPHGTVMMRSELLALRWAWPPVSGAVHSRSSREEEEEEEVGVPTTGAHHRHRMLVEAGNSCLFRCPLPH